MNSLTSFETTQERSLIPITIFVIVLHLLVFFLSDNYTDKLPTPKVKERLIVTTISLNEKKDPPKLQIEPLLVPIPIPTPIPEPIAISLPEPVIVREPTPSAEPIVAMAEPQPEPLPQPKPEPIPLSEPEPTPPAPVPEKPLESSKPEPKSLPKPEPKPTPPPKPKPPEAIKPQPQSQPQSKPQPPPPKPKPKPEPEPVKKKEPPPALAKKVEKKPLTPPPEKKSAPVKKDPPKTAVKKEVEKTPAKKEVAKPIPEKKKEAPPQPSTPKIDPEVVAAQEAAKAKRQALLSSVQKSIAKIERTHDKLSASTEMTQAALAIPRPIENLQIETLIIEKPPNLTPQQIGYHEELASRLKLLLRLPDFGEVKIKLTVERSGRFIKVAVVSAESASNRKYLEKTLPTLKFPGFGSHFGSAEECTFAIALSNDY
jgi:hypothetical protein